MLFDDVLKQHIGQMGHFQRVLLAIMCLEEYFVAFATLLPVFTAAIPQFWCEEPELEATNCTDAQQRALSSPGYSSDSYDQCRAYDVNYTSLDLNTMCLNGTGALLPSNLSTTSCRAWSYDISVFYYTMTVEWDLVCQRAWLGSTASAVFMAGRAAGNFVFGYLADRFGRRKIVLVATSLTVASGLACAASPNIWMYLAFRFAWAFFSTGKTNTNYVLICEFTGPDWRTISCNIYFLCWCFGHMMLAGVAYMITHWRLLTVILVLPEVIFILLFYFLIPESPRWLLTKDRTEEAHAIIEKMAAKNGRELPDAKKMEIKVEVQENHMTAIDLCRTPQICILTVSLSYAWFAGGFIYYGLSLNTASLGGNPYVNFVLNGAVEVPGYIFCGIACKYLGRVMPLSASFFLTGAMLLAIIPISPDRVWLIVSLAMAGKFFINIAVSILWTCSSESYPTCMRNIGVANTAIAGRLSSVLSAYVGLLANISPVLPQMIFGVMALLAGAVVLLAPETKGQAMPQTVRAGEKFIKQNRLISKLWRRGKRRQVPAQDDPDKKEGQPLKVMA